METIDWDEFLKELEEEKKIDSAPLLSLTWPQFKGRLSRRFDDVIRWTVGGYKRGGVVGLYHWVRCHVWNRYHVIDLGKVSPTEYKWGYIDPCEALLLSCFSQLERFVEAGGLTMFDRTYHPGVFEELEELWNWWSKGRHDAQRSCDELWTQISSEGWHNAYRSENYELWLNSVREIEAVEQINLERLVKLRQYLWT